MKNDTGTTPTDSNHNAVMDTFIHLATEVLIEMTCYDDCKEELEIIR